MLCQCHNTDGVPQNPSITASDLNNIFIIIPHFSTVLSNLWFRFIVQIPRQMFLLFEILLFFMEKCNFYGIIIVDQSFYCAAIFKVIFNQY